MADCHRLGPLEPTGRGQSFQLAFGKEQSATFCVSMHSVSSMSYPRRLTEARHSFLPFPRRNLSLHLPFCGFLCALYQFHKVCGRGGGIMSNLHRTRFGYTNCAPRNLLRLSSTTCCRWCQLFSETLNKLPSFQLDHARRD